MTESRIAITQKPLTLKNVLLIVAGSIMYAGSLNIFMNPLNLYASGFPGLSQVIRTIFFSNITGIDPAGVINLCLNIPLFLLAWKSMSKKMVVGTAVSVLVQTLTLSLLRQPSLPLLDDKLACIVIAGLGGGIGCGVILTNGGSGGGLDLLGVYVSQKIKGFSVGLLNIGFNILLYTFMAIRFDLSTALYSVIFVVIFSIIIDRWHYQNIELELMIFSHHPEVKDMIMKKYVRGVTCWDGIGAYTNKSTNVIVTVVAKSEVEEIKKDIITIDPQAFIIVHEGTTVTGGYEKRLV